jgi:hypothetical protein
MRDNTPLMMLESMGRKYYERICKLYKRIIRHHSRYCGNGSKP